MKTQLLLIATIAFFISCTKETNLPPIGNQHNLNTDERIGQLMKFSCIGGDTLFADTLILKLESIYRSQSNNDEIFYYSFSYPVWHNYYYEGSGQDIQLLTGLNFTSPECKSAYFKLIK